MSPSVCASYTQASALSLQRLPHRCSQMGFRQAASKNGCTNKLKQSASEINADLLKYYAEIQKMCKEFEVQETAPTTPTTKGCIQTLRMKNATRRTAGRSTDKFLGGV